MNKHALNLIACGVKILQTILMYDDSSSSKISRYGQPICHIDVGGGSRARGSRCGGEGLWGCWAPEGSMKKIGPSGLSCFKDMDICHVISCTSCESKGDFVEHLSCYKLHQL